MQWPESKSKRNAVLPSYLFFWQLGEIVWPNADTAKQNWKAKSKPEALPCNTKRDVSHNTSDRFLPPGPLFTQQPIFSSCTKLHQLYKLCWYCKEQNPCLRTNYAQNHNTNFAAYRLFFACVLIKVPKAIRLVSFLWPRVQIQTKRSNKNSRIDFWRVLPPICKHKQKHTWKLNNFLSAS